MWQPIADVPLAYAFQEYGVVHGYTTILSQVTFSVPAGSSLAVLGPTGSGKSILLLVMAQLLWQSFPQRDITQQGECRILGHSVSPRKPQSAISEHLRSKIVLVGENSAWLPLSIAENFELVQSVLPQHHAVVSYHDWLNSLPLTKLNRARLLSVGELLPRQVEPALLQQLAILRALLRRPDILLLDDPLIKMDPVLGKQTEGLLMELPESTTVVWATNDLSLASRTTDHTLFLLHGRSVEFTPTESFFTSPATPWAEDFIAGRESTSTFR